MQNYFKADTVKDFVYLSQSVRDYHHIFFLWKFYLETGYWLGVCYGLNIHMHGLTQD